MLSSGNVQNVKAVSTIVASAGKDHVSGNPTISEHLMILMAERANYFWCQVNSYDGMKKL